MVEGGSLELVDELESLFRARERGTIEETLDFPEEDNIDFLLEEVDERDLKDLDVRWGVEMRRGIGRMDSCGWVVEDVRPGVSGGSTAEILPL